MRTVLIAALLTASSSMALAQTPPGPPVGAPAASGAVAFPASTRIAFIDPERILAVTAEGKRLGDSLLAFRQKKVAELGEKNQQLQGLQARRQQSGALLAPSALDALDKDISRLNLEIERGAQDADAEYNDRLGRVQLEFRTKLQPILIKVLEERQVNALLTPSPGLGWVDPAIDLTDVVAARVDQAYPAEKPSPGKK